MECRDLKETLSACVDGEADAGEVFRVEEHLAACPSCRADAARMRAADGLLTRVEAKVPDDFRETLFARLEKEELLPKRRSLFAFSVRWLAVPAAAAAALALFLLTAKDGGENVRKTPEPSARLAQRAPEAPAPAPSPRETPARPAGEAVVAMKESAAAPAGKAARESAVASAGNELSPEEREIVAYLEVLENPTVFEGSGDIDEMDIFTAPKKDKG
ncbi:MAG: zf-HC2 domain-containing protein [Deltaproteobacteria bacterium]|nr:zf-HC2 domain-containing protein [Deltaproteobacteria bacterium]